VLGVWRISQDRGRLVALTNCAAGDVNQMQRQVERPLRDEPHWGPREIRELLVGRPDADLRPVFYSIENDRRCLFMRARALALCFGDYTEC
jgi:hypothetical protein